MDRSQIIPKGTVPIFDPLTKEVLAVPEDEAPNYLSSGRLPATREQVQDIIDQRTYGESPVKASAIAVTRGLLPLVGDIALEKSGLLSKEDLRKYEEYNPYISGTGEAVGTVIPALLSGGESLLAKAGFKGLAKTGAVAGKATIPGLLAKGGEKVAAKLAPELVSPFAKAVLPSMVDVGLQSAGYGFADAMDEAFLQDKDLLSEQVLSNAGIRAVLSGVAGAATQGVFSAGGYSLRNVASKAADKLATVRKQAEKMADDIDRDALIDTLISESRIPGGAAAAGEIGAPPIASGIGGDAFSQAKTRAEIVTDAISAATDKTKKTILEKLNPKDQRLATRLFELAKKPGGEKELADIAELVSQPYREGMQREFADNLATVVDGFNEVKGVFDKELRPEAMKKAIASGGAAARDKLIIDPEKQLGLLYPPVSQQAAVDSFNKTMVRAQGVIEEMREYPGTYPSSMVDRVEALMDDTVKKTLKQAKAPTPKQIFENLDALKGEMDPILKWGKENLGASESAIQKARGIRSIIKNSLEDGTTWGKAGELQSRINDSYKDLLGVLGTAERKKGTMLQRFLELDMVAPGKFEPHVHTGKLDTWLRSVDKQRKDRDTKLLMSFYDNLGKFYDTVGEVANYVGKGSEYEGLSGKIAAARDTATKQAREYELGNQLTRIGWRENYMAEPLDLKGALLKGIGSYVPGIKQLIAGSEKLAALNEVNTGKPINQILAAAQMKSLKDRFAESLATTANDFVSAATKPATVATSVLSQIEKPLVSKEIQKLLPENDLMPIDQRRQEIQHLADSAGAAMPHIDGQIQNVEQHFPQMGDVLRGKIAQAIGIIKSTLPGSMSSTLFDNVAGNETRIPDSMMSSISRKLRALDSFDNFLEDFKKGHVAPDTIEITRQYYQRSLQELQNQMVEAISKSKEPLPYWKKALLSKVFGMSTHKSFEPASIKSLQDSFAQPQTSGNAGQAPTKPLNIDMGKFDSNISRAERR